MGTEGNVKAKAGSANGNRDSFRSKSGFILACIGSAVGMGNVWLFPTRISAYGGATFLIPYLLFVVLISASGVIEEMSYGRAMRGGPIKAFGKTFEMRGLSAKAGKLLGAFPVLNSLAMAIGYSVIVGWICIYTFNSFTGAMAPLEGVESFSGLFGSISADNALWQTVGMVIAIGILVLGVGKGIEKANKVMMPLFFVMFIGLAIYVATLPGAAEGYRYIFVLDPAGLADPLVWVYALGQAFFSLSIAGNGTLVYGSYLGDDVDVPNSAKYVGIFCTIAAVLAALVIIPAMASAGQQLTEGGPGLLFIYLPNLFATMPGGPIFMAVFFVAVLFAGMTSLINLFEAPIATVQELFGASRTVACIVIGIIGLAVGLAIQAIVSQWMDVCSVYFCPIGAALAGILFMWLARKDWVMEQVNKGRAKVLGPWFYPLTKYVFPAATILVLVLGSLLGGIG